MALIPYLAVMRAGIPGVSIDNDMAGHLLWAEEIVSPSLTAGSPLPLTYPLGPHAMAAVIGKGLGIRIDQAFSGWIISLPLIGAWTVLALIRRAHWLGRMAAATVVGMPFLVAAYYGEGSFKEVLLAVIVLAFVALVAEGTPASGQGRWVPFTLLLGGVLSLYSVAGLPWPLLIIGAWLVAVSALQVRRSGVPALIQSARGELVALGLAVLVPAILLVPQMPRLVHFVSLGGGVIGNGNGLGNLVSPLPGWEAFGVWSNVDFRLPPHRPSPPGCGPRSCSRWSSLAPRGCGARGAGCYPSPRRGRC